MIINKKRGNINIIINIIILLISINIISVYALTQSATLNSSISGTWSTPDNALGNHDNLCATIITEFTPKEHTWKWTGFNILNGATINGLEVTLHYDIKDDILIVRLSPDNFNYGASKNITKSGTPSCPDSINITLGNSTDLWGITWNISNINDDVYLNLTALENLEGKNITVDFVELTIHYTPDTTFPLIDFGIGTETNNTKFNRNWIYVNITVTEINEDNITFYLYNPISNINTTTYTTPVRTINWTNLIDGIYYYNVTVIDKASNINSTETRVITLDTTPPTISNITETIAQTTATIGWKTDESSNSSINYGLIQNLSSSISSSSLVTSHTLGLTELSSNTFYYYNITSCDSVNNCRTNGTFNFTTSIISPTSGGGGGGGRREIASESITNEKQSTPVSSSRINTQEETPGEITKSREEYQTTEREEEKQKPSLWQRLKQEISLTGKIIYPSGIIPNQNTIIAIVILILLAAVGVYEEKKLNKTLWSKLFTKKPKKTKEETQKELEKIGFKIKPTTKSSELLNALQQLKKIGNIEGSAAISREGLIITSNISAKTGAEKFSATSTVMIDSAETALKKLNRGKLNHIIMNTSTRKVIAMSAGNKAILVCLVKPRGNLGLMLLEIKKVANKISKILE